MREGEGFRYLRPNGKPVRDGKTMERIASLAIPPAYEDVWICADADGHLQAVGRDAAGRKQYRYHPEFRAGREQAKFGRMLKFAAALPRIHEAVTHDLARRGVPREKAVAAVVELLEKSLVRVGSEEYKEERGTVGLTTMDMGHAEIHGDRLRFRFKGKSAVDWDVGVKDRRVARAVRLIGDLPGQRLFQYVGEDGAVHPVTSDDVNRYLHEVSGGPFTAKDFRTWAGTCAALERLALVSPWPEAKGAQKRAVSAAMKDVAARLGNTPAVCRTSYVHPGVVEAFEQGALAKAMRPGESVEEALARLLRSFRRQGIKRQNP